MSSLRQINTGLVLAGLLIVLKRIHRTDQSGHVYAAQLVECGLAEANPCE